MDLIGVEPLAPQQGESAVLDVFAARLKDLREAAARTKDFAEADRLKAALVDANVEVRIDAGGVTLSARGALDRKMLEELL